MKVLITGGSGLIGKQLIAMLLHEGHQVWNLTTQRNMESASVSLKHIYWNPVAGVMPEIEITNCDAVINLAGSSVAQRWTPAYKQMMMDSRVLSTRTIANIIAQMDVPPKVLIQASAAGLYPSSASPQPETTAAGQGFLASLTSTWEAEADKIAATGLRTVVLRTGVVLSKQGGALHKMLHFFRFGLGAAVGSGKQMVSWIHLHDICRFILFALQNEKISGPFNLAAPGVLSNKEFSEALAKAMRKPFFLPPVPSFMMKILFGEMASIVLEGQYLDTSKILATGFQFQFADLSGALDNLFAPPNTA